MNGVRDAMVRAAVARGASPQTAASVAGNVLQCLAEHVRSSNLAHARCGLPAMTDPQCEAMVLALDDMAAALGAMRRDNKEAAE